MYLLKRKEIILEFLQSMASSGLSKRSNGYLGVTEPISWSGPTEFDITKTQELEKVSLCSWAFVYVSSLIFGKIGFLNYDLCFAQYLADAGLYESQEGAVSREEVLGRLDQVIPNFM